MELPLSLLESMLHPGIVLHSWDILNIDHGKFFDYPFLRYDSFLSASHLKEIDKDELTAQLKKGVAEIVGELKKEHLCDVKEMCLASRIFTAADKAAYFV